MQVSSRLEELERRVQRDPASISFAALAEEYRRLGLFQEAIDTCRAGLTRHPSYLSARVTLGRALLEIGNFDAAAIELEQVLRTAPENLAAIRALADIHRRRGEMPDAIEHYDVSLAEAEPPPVPVSPAPVPVSEAPLPLSAAPESSVPVSASSSTLESPVPVSLESPVPVSAEPEVRIRVSPAPEIPVPISAAPEIPVNVSPVPEVPVPVSPVPVSPTAPIAVKSSVVEIPAEHPALAGLEAFLMAIQRARREVTLHSAR
jgi:hypothetical protein